MTKLDQENPYSAMLLVLKLHFSVDEIRKMLEKAKEKVKTKVIATELEKML